jgi:hypothetical protein
MNVALKAVLGIVGGFSAVMLADYLMGKITDWWKLSVIGPFKR